MKVYKYTEELYICNLKVCVMQYYKVYLQKETDGSEVKETIDAFGIYCAEMPFTLAQKAKDITTRDWNDEQGIDAYVPQTLMLKDYDMNVKFCCKGDKFTSNAKIKAFIDYLTGRDGSGVYLKMYCDYTRIGRRHVRFTELKDNAELIREDGADILVFTVVFNVDDPVTDIGIKATDNDGNVTNIG